MFLNLHVHICISRCSIEMGFGSKWSILNGQVIYIEKSKFNIADMWFIPLDPCHNFVLFKWEIIQDLSCTRFASVRGLFHLKYIHRLQGRIQVWADSAPASPFWQLNHANSACFGSISANFCPILTIGPPLFANPGSGPALCEIYSKISTGGY